MTKTTDTVTIVFDADIANETNLPPYYLIVEENGIKHFVDLENWTYEDALTEAENYGFAPTHFEMEDGTVHKLSK